jgi:Ras-related GTP-binding protein C/D
MFDPPIGRKSRPHAPFLGRQVDFFASRDHPWQKAGAELSLVDNLQGNNQVTTSTQGKSAEVPNTKGPDAKPRLLLMGLRRYVLLPPLE